MKVVNTTEYHIAKDELCAAFGIKEFASIQLVSRDATVQPVVDTTKFEEVKITVKEETLKRRRATQETQP